MAKHEQYKDFDTYTLISQDGRTQATFVPEKGGVGSSIIMPFKGEERELLFCHAHFWERGNPSLPGGWPFIFPICARIERAGIAGNYLYDGEVYNLPIHGFASRMSWEVNNHGGHDTLTIVLRDNADTFEHYPFSFLVELKYQVSEGMLLCSQRYSNTGNKPMPYYAGFHPYFLTPPAGNGKEGVILNYNPTRRFIYNEKLTDLVGTQKLFSLPASVADPVINEQLVELGEDKTITLNYPDGFVLNMLAEGAEDPDLFNYVQLYTQPNESFICVEPWMSFPNALNSVSGVRWLPPGKSEHGILKLWINE